MNTNTIELRIKKRIYVLYAKVRVFLYQVFVTTNLLLNTVFDPPTQFSLKTRKVLSKVLCETVTIGGQVKLYCFK